MLRKSKKLPRTKPRIQELAEDKAEKKIRTNAFKKPQISKLCSSKLLSLSQRSGLRKHWAAVLPPQGGFNPPPTGDGVLDKNLRSAGPSSYLFPDSSSQRFLFPPPKSSPSRSGGNSSSAAICGAGASWRLLGRKNRVPRGFQKLFKF